VVFIDTRSTKLANYVFTFMVERIWSKAYDHLKLLHYKRTRPFAWYPSSIRFLVCYDIFIYYL